MLFTAYFNANAEFTTPPTIEVTGTATINIVPDRITIEIGMEEYFEHHASGDSSLVKLSQIEKKVRNTLSSANIPDSMVVVSDIGNYLRPDKSSDILMAKRLTATVSDFDSIELISEQMDRKGITSFHITKTDNTEIDSYNRRGLKAALDAARDKAEFIAGNENVVLLMPYEIIQTGPNYFETPSFSNVSFDSGSGMENMRRIVRRYSVKVRYIIGTK